MEKNKTIYTLLLSRSCSPIDWHVLTSTTAYWVLVLIGNKDVLFECVTTHLTSASDLIDEFD